MTSPAAPAKHRQWGNNPALNSSSNDFYTDSGIRISTPIYVEISQSIRKDQFNKLRSIASQPDQGGQQPKSQSGITVQTFSTGEPTVESKLGMTLENLRMVIFGRGSIDLGLLLRIQAITGDELVSIKDIESAFKDKARHIKQYVKDAAA